MKDFQIANMALDLLGADRISSLADPTRFGKAVAGNFNIAAEEVLRAYDWPFSISYVVPQANEGDEPLNGFSYSYLLPEDYVSVLKFGNSDYSIGGGVIYSNEPPGEDLKSPVLKYISRKEIESWPGYFCNLVATYLASLLANIAGKPEYGEQLRRRYEYSLSNIITRDAPQWNPRQSIGEEKHFTDF